jgi:hypothetical protein
MISNKKGLSTVVTTLIIILLVLVAIGIIWIVVRGLIETGSQTIDLRTKCLNVDVRATSVFCGGASNQTCNVTLYRKTGSEDIGGVVMIFHNDTKTSSQMDSSTYGVTNIGLLSTVQTTPIGTGIGTPNDVDVVVYFKNEKGESQLCEQINPFSDIKFS